MIFPAEQSLKLWVLRVKVNRKKPTNKKYVGKCQVQPIFENYIYIFRTFLTRQSLHRDSEEPGGVQTRTSIEIVGTMTPTDQCDSWLPWRPKLGPGRDIADEEVTLVYDKTQSIARRSAFP